MKLLTTLPALLLIFGTVQAGTPPIKTAATVRFETCAKPVWPPQALRDEQTGTVTLDFLIDDEGHVLEALVRQSSGAPLLDETALSAISRCQFKPLTLDGVPNGGWQKMQYVWTLETPEKGQAMLLEAESHRKAALEGDAEALYKFAQILRTGNGYEVKPDPSRYFKLLQASAERGYPEAEFELGVAYQYDRSIQQDLPQALAWYRNAADHGLLKAQLKLALFYENGEGATPDPINAMPWYRQAAEQGDHDAEDAMGRFTEADRNYAQAATWYRKAAHGESKDGSYHLGALYLHGLGVAKDIPQAVQWLEKATAQRQPEAEAAMANLYFTGTGVAQNDATGFKYLRRAANAGNIRAMRQLGLMLSQGVHGAADLTDGARWLKRAALLGLAGPATEAVNYTEL